MSARHPAAYRRGMMKQVVTSFLWFFTTAWGWNIIAAVTGVPAVIGVALGIGAGAFVWADPLHLIRPSHVAEPVDRVAGGMSQPVRRPI